MTTPDIPRSEIANALEFRHACKAFDASRKIPDPDVELIVDAIRLAPSSYGFEPWNVIIAQSEDLRNAVKAFAGNNAARFDASHFLIFTAKTGLQITRKGGHIDHILRDVRGLDDDEADDFKAFWTKWAERDFKLITADVVHQWAARQAYIALGGAMLAAAERGIDSCPIEGFSIDGVREILTERGLIDPTDSSPVVGHARSGVPSRRPAGAFEARPRRDRPLGLTRREAPPRNRTRTRPEPSRTNSNREPAVRCRRIGNSTQTEGGQPADKRPAHKGGPGEPPHEFPRARFHALVDVDGGRGD